VSGRGRRDARIRTDRTCTTGTGRLKQAELRKSFKDRLAEHSLTCIRPGPGSARRARGSGCRHCETKATRERALTAASRPRVFGAELACAVGGSVDCSTRMSETDAKATGSAERPRDAVKLQTADGNNSDRREENAHRRTQTGRYLTWSSRSQRS